MVAIKCILQFALIHSSIIKINTVFHFKTGNVAKFRQISSKINIFATRVVLVISSVFCTKLMPSGA